MESVLLVIHLIVAMAIIAVVLIQPAEAGGFLGSGGSMSNMMAPRRSADVLTRVTTGLAGCFFATSLLLAIFASHKPAHKSILEAAAPAPAAATSAPVKLDETKKPAASAKAATKKPETPTAPVSK